MADYRFKIEISDAAGPFLECECHTQEQVDKILANAKRMNKTAVLITRW